ncbi:conserved virulence factor C family protein [Marinicrinis lubricantis]|uniref:Conserved virulence factor C family protein n=1 Tax=Marinicrinis lubricantis TaxID=2086470 RepID=A0ABW1INK2_9BACL
MKIISIEPTPSPNTMKLNMDERVEKARTYTQQNADRAPDYIKKMLAIPDVKSIFHTADFIAVDRSPKGDWKQILAQVQAVFGEKVSDDAWLSGTDTFGEVKVYVQMFRKIPMQIRVKTEWNEVRKSLSPRFVEAAMEAGMGSPNLIKERKLEDFGVRYGEPEDIAQEVQEELEAAYSSERLDTLKEKARQIQPGEEVELPEKDWSVDELLEVMNDSDWRRRYAALDQMKPEVNRLPVIERALSDENASIRRLAVVYLGDLKDDTDVLPLLYKAAKDSSASVRRTAGDTLSDIGDARAIPVMCDALHDKNKLVRWRAARYLYEVGDESALPALKQAKDDPEFEVSLQVHMAIERIEAGEEAAGTVWQQMTKLRQQELQDS